MIMPVTLPPPQYNHPPSILVIEHVLTAEEVDAICHARHALGWDGRAPPPRYRFSGCAHVTARSCEVWRIDDGAVRRHELGHCNGWPSNHPTAQELANRPATPYPRAVLPLSPEQAKTFEEASQRSIQRNGPPDVLLRQVLEKPKAPEPQ